MFVFAQCTVCVITEKVLIVEHNIEAFFGQVNTRLLDQVIAKDLFASGRQR